MEEFETESGLDELARLCDELGLDHMDAEACACETHIFIDAEGNPHECWEAGFGHVNVAVAMTPEQAVHITDFKELREQLQDSEHEESVAWDRVRKAEAESAKLREQGARLFDKTLELGTENAKLRELVCMMLRVAGVAEYATDSEWQVVTDYLRELGIEVD